MWVDDEERGGPALTYRSYLLTRDNDNVSTDSHQHVSINVAHTSPAAMNQDVHDDAGGVHRLLITRSMSYFYFPLIA
ncbi:hypothetical protein E2C01_025836 [Portunus trituberculatus]|uniref:Uncharacterized protein n=1 Tax=Portunus trituberculatus TaxID=210409 RepID=A0A5B7EHJ7_PORTR|nr:hypothetical protein [Portunus trituberculatus]